MTARITKVVVALFLSIFLIFKTVIGQLKENRIAYESMKISTALEVEVEGFNLNIDNVNLDLSFLDLIVGEFKEKSCCVKGAKIEM